jgi:micrococcal nuclease
VKILLKLQIPILTVLFLSACGESDMVNDFEDTRSYWSDRLGNKSTNEVGRKWYSWQMIHNAEKMIAPDKTQLLEAKVTNIVDGDTADVLLTNGKQERIRFILVNSPESKGDYEDAPQPFSIEASEFTKSILTDRKVWIEKGIEARDEYGRLLVYVWLDQVVLNEEVKNEDGETVLVAESLGFVTLNELLLREGLAQVAIFPPNTKYVDEFEEVQKVAKKAKKGIWN